MKRVPKKLSEYSKSYWYKLIKEVKDSLGCLSQSDYEVTTILVKSKNKRFRQIPVIDDRPTSGNPPVDKDLLERLELAIMLKDKFHISDAAYKALTSISDLPTFYAISQIIQKANAVLTLQRTPGEEPGVQRDLEELLKIKINALVDEDKLGNVNESTDIHVKISGDGTQVGHCCNFVNITCTLLNDQETANSPEGHEPIAIIAAPEKYDVLQSHLADISNAISNFTS